MARIRTVKPEFWDSPDTARASHRCRLFYLAMWNWADDWGVGTANGKQLVGFAFPNDDDISAADFPSLRKEVADAYGVVFYEVNGRPYYWIPSFDKHQRTERKAKGINPLPPEGYTMPDLQEPDDEEPSDDNVGSSDDKVGGMSLGTGEQGNRGTGEVKACASPQAAPTERDRFPEFWIAYPRKVDKAKAEKAWKAARKKAPQGDIIAGAMRYAADANRDDAYTKYPASWLNAGSWENGPEPSRAAASAKPNAATQRNNEGMARLHRMAEQEANPFHQLALGAGQ